MASGHVNRANRPNTWLHRAMLRREIVLANSEPSTHGPSRRGALPHNSGRFQGIAEVDEPRPVAEGDARDP
jgi:hypothetical protein